MGRDIENKKKYDILRREENREHIKSYGKQYRKKNIEKTKKYQSDYYIKNKNTILDYCKIKYNKKTKRKIMLNKITRSIKNIFICKTPKNKNKNYKIYKQTNIRKYYLLPAWKINYRKIKKNTKAKIFNVLIWNRFHIINIRSYVKHKKKSNISKYISHISKRRSDVLRYTRNKIINCITWNRFALINKKLNKEKKRISKQIKRERRRMIEMNVSNWTITTKNIYNILCEQNMYCVYCWSNIDWCFDMDHIIPISKHWTHTINNIQLLCRNCNLVKSNKLVFRNYW